MRFRWIDYEDVAPELVEAFIDSEAAKSTGLDDGFSAYFSYWISERDTLYNENFWCKVIFDGDVPLGVIAIGCASDGAFTVSEMIVAPDMRGKGYGTAILREILACSDSILACKISQARAVIFPENRSSVRAFEKAGFRLIGEHADGDALYYEYSADGA